ncbi:MAG: MlaD family protein [Gemmataceae bacterium]|nr:MlaD family protein [Gemmataceae bacterium]
MAERRLRLRLGLFVAATLVVLSGLVVLFGGAPALFSTKVGYTVLFPEAPGIATGTPIRKSGVRVGEVTKIDLDPESGQVRVVVAMDPKYPPRTSEDPTITRGLLSGDTAIDFLPRLDPATGQPAPRGADYPPWSDIPGLPPVTARSLLTPASEVLNTAQASLDRMVRSFERLEKVAPQLERTLQEFEHLAHDVREFIPELKKTNDRLRNFIGEDIRDLPNALVAAETEAAAAQSRPAERNDLKSLIRDIRELLATVRPAVDEIRGVVRRAEPEVVGAAKSARATFDAVNEVLSPENRKQIAELIRNLNGIGGAVLRLAGGFQGLLDEAQRTVQNFDRRTALTADVLADIRAVTQPLGQRGQALAADIAESAASLSKVLTEVRELTRAFGRENGTIQKLLTDEGLYKNLEAASCELARVLARADKIAKDLEVFADKVARRPELIGIGGALRPSSGLKDAPLAPLPPGLPSYRPDWPPAIPAQGNGPDWLQRPAPVQGLPPKP